MLLNLVKNVLGSSSSGMITDWGLPDDYDRDGVASLVPDQPMSGLMVALSLIVSLVSPLLVLFFLLTILSLFGIIGGEVMLIRFVPAVMFSPVEVFVLVPGPLQSVQRAEMWGVILALQSSSAVHLGVDNLGVVRHVGRLLDDTVILVPFLLNLSMMSTCSCLLIGCFIFVVVRRFGFLRLRGFLMVGLGKLTGCAADEAADFGRRRIGNAVIDARRNLSGVCCRWYPVILDLHRFFIANFSCCGAS